jgi:hypothetical protein
MKRAWAPIWARRPAILSDVFHGSQSLQTNGWLRSFLSDHFQLFIHQSSHQSTLCSLGTDSVVKHKSIWVKDPIQSHTKQVAVRFVFWKADESCNSVLRLKSV